MPSVPGDYAPAPAMSTPRPLPRYVEFYEVRAIDCIARFHSGRVTLLSEVGRGQVRATTPSNCTKMEKRGRSLSRTA
jgi:hypothetical protein